MSTLRQFFGSIFPNYLPSFMDGVLYSLVVLGVCYAVTILIVVALIVRMYVYGG